MLGMEISDQVEAEFNTCDEETFSIDADYFIDDIDVCVDQMENRTECAIPEQKEFIANCGYISINSPFVLALAMIVNMLLFLNFISTLIALTDMQ